MSDFTFREATIHDVPFLVDTIIEAEKSGTDILTYHTIFGLTIEETREYIAKMLMEEVDGCELSISSFLLAEKNGEIAAAVGAWIEGIDGISSTVLKGNLLNFSLPKKCIEKATKLNQLVRELHIDYVQGAIQIGLVYVESRYRGINLAGLLIEEQISRLRNMKPTVSEIYVQVFSNNKAAIKAYEKIHFNIQLVKETTNNEIHEYMPSDKKVLMKRNIIID